MWHYKLPSRTQASLTGRREQRKIPTHVVSYKEIFTQAWLSPISEILISVRILVTFLI